MADVTDSPVSTLRHTRTSTQADDFLAALIEVLNGRFGPDLISTYIVGSRAANTVLSSSDIDLALVFRGKLAPERRAEIRRWLRKLQALTPVMMDTVVVDETEIVRGLTSNLVCNRLLAGADTFAGLPQVKRSEMLLYHGGLAVHFMLAVRGWPKRFTFPLTYPQPDGRFRGYELSGTRVAEGQYVPGLNIYAGLVLGLASFRLAIEAGAYPGAKGEALPAYRQHLPHDRYRPLVEDVEEICRSRHQGRIPTDEFEISRLSLRCTETLAWENEVLGLLLLNLPAWLPLDNPELRKQAIEFLSLLDCHSPQHAAEVATAKKMLGMPA